MIPIARPDFGPEEIEAVTEVLKSGMVAQPPAERASRHRSVARRRGRTGSLQR